MFSISQLALFFLLAAFIVHDVTVDAAVMPSVCSVEQEAATACNCCKKSCWTGIADMMTAYFGHMPGEGDDAEAKLALALILRCFDFECSDICPAPRPPSH